MENVTVSTISQPGVYLFFIRVFNAASAETCVSRTIPLIFNSLVRSMAQKLCTLSELENPGTLECDAIIAGRKTPLFVVRRDNVIRAYLNFCPHTGVTLNWRPNDFLTVDRDYIQCATHGALFQLEDGYCVWGPCARQSLTSLPVQIEDNDVILDL